MKNKKRILAGFLRATHLLDLLGRVPENVLIIINYHRIYKGKLDTLFDVGVFGPSVDEFDQQIKFLSKNASLVNEADVIRMALSGEPLTERSVLITFDDGYGDNYSLAKPVLEKYNVPAVFFIPINTIEQSKLGWWDIIAYFINSTTRKSVPFKGKDLILGTARKKEFAIGVMLHHMKSTKYEESRDFLSELSLLCDVPFPEKEVQARELMNWGQIQEIAASELFSIGSHTISHRVLSTISDEDELQELRNSKDFLQQKLGCEIKSIAYPVGGYHAFSDRTKSNARKAGYSVGFSFNTGVNRETISDPFDVMRIGPEMDLSTFKCTIVFPKIFA